MDSDNVTMEQLLDIFDLSGAFADKPMLVPDHTWENPPAPAEPNIDDIRVIVTPGIHRGVWFHIEKYYAKQKWDNAKGEWVDNIGWWEVDKSLFGGHDKGTVYRWSRDETRAMARATKMIQKQYKREADYEARKSRIKNGTKTFRIVTDR